MSRRTKLLITAFFLVLVTIPTAYLSFTWAPKNPLRFRMLSSVDGKAPSFNELVTQFEVENTSAVSIYLMEGRFFGPWKAGAEDATMPSGYAQSVIFHFDGVPVNPPAVIAPHSTFRYTTLIGRDLRERIEMNGAEMVYIYRSGTKHRAFMLHRRIRQCLPESLARRLRTPFVERDRVPIELPP